MMGYAIYFRALISLALVCVLLNVALGCQPQLCRRKRYVKSRTVKLQLHGCSAHSPVWTRQIAYCLRLRVTVMTLGIKNWYATAYEECAQEGCASYIASKDNSDVEECVRCWKKAVSDNEVMLREFNVTKVDVTKCLTDYIHAFLNNDLPVFKTESRFKSHIDLPKVRPVEYWWSVTVILPCEPKVFEYTNAYCINSFAKEWRQGEYVLVQNRRITKDQISFVVEFSDSCTFEPEEVEIIWDESTPAAALPQISSFPSQFPPEPNNQVNIYYDLQAALLLTDVNDGDVEEYKLAAKSRVKRQADYSRLSQIGIELPCQVQSFQPVASDQQIRSYRIIESAIRRFLIDTDALCLKGNGFCNRTSLIRFNLDYGYERTGCIFHSGEIQIVPNPTEDWVHQDPGPPRKKKIICATCINKPTHRECLDVGTNSTCAADEICQTEVRQITETQKLITKSCKQKHACDANMLGINSEQCTPGLPGSVCRCCCSTTSCNSDDEHHAGERFICKYFTANETASEASVQNLGSSNSIEAK